MLSKPIHIVVSLRLLYKHVYRSLLCRCQYSNFSFLLMYVTAVSPLTPPTFFFFLSGHRTGHICLLHPSCIWRSSLWLHHGQAHHLLAVPGVQRRPSGDHHHPRLRLRHLLHRREFSRRVWSFGHCDARHRDQLEEDQHQPRS